MERNGNMKQMRTGTGIFIKELEGFASTKCLSHNYYISHINKMILGLVLETILTVERKHAAFFVNSAYHVPS